MILVLCLQGAFAFTCAVLDTWEDPTPPPPSEIHWLCPNAVSPDCYTWDMSSVGDVEYRFNDNDFTNAEMDAIEQAADAWEGGWSKVNRGAWLELTRTQGAGDGALDNGVNNVRRKPNSYFQTHGYGGSGAFVLLYVNDDCEHIAEFDMTFQPSSTDESLDLPSEVGSGEFSLAQLALHEFGHALGIGDDATQLHAMDDRTPHGGDLGRTAYRLHEEDFYALRELYPGSSTGGNLMLGRFAWRPVNGENVATEVWKVDEPTTRTWQACPGQTVAAGGPEKLQAVITGHIGFTASPLIRWVLEPDPACLIDGDEVSVGTRQPTMGVHYPYEVWPSAGYQIPADTPLGSYLLCARINDDYAITETSLADNLVGSEAVFEVVACP